MIRMRGEEQVFGEGLQNFIIKIRYEAQAFGVGLHNCIIKFSECFVRGNILNRSKSFHDNLYA
jgi:hypothetical protein